MSYAAAEVAPTAARRHAWIAVLVVGIALFIAIERTLVATGNPNFVPSAILVGAAIVPAAFLTFVFLPMVGVALIEETSKLLIPLAVLIFFRRYRTRADGLLIGVAAGAGFAALETTLHSAWDSQASLIGTAVVAIVGLLALGWTVHRTAAARPRATEP